MELLATIFLKWVVILAVTAPMWMLVVAFVVFFIEEHRRDKMEGK